jgi:hypothetical protein
VTPQAFVTAAHWRLDYQRTHAQILVDGVTWVIGFVHGRRIGCHPQQVNKNKRTLDFNGTPPS